MPVSVIIGGQFGSEGKGKAALFFADELQAAAVVRVGGPNSGHTAIDKSGNRIVFRHLPTAAMLGNVACVLPAGSYIVPEILFRELAQSQLPEGKLLIDPNAMVVSAEDIASERRLHLNDLIGSTASGTGAAVIRRSSRHHSVTLARDDARLSRFIIPTILFMRNLLLGNRRIIIEGTQGYGLSVLHSPYYPFATSRDTTAAAFVSESGLSPIDVDDIIMVLRAFPIRVAGNSGPLPRETDWDTVTRIGAAKHPLVEHTSVTHRVRRVAEFDPAIVVEAIKSNNPSRLVLNHLDYYDSDCSNGETPTDRALSFVAEIEKLICRRIDYVGCGPSVLIKTEAIIGRGSKLTNKGVFR